MAVALDTSGALYVASVDHRIRKITPNGSVMTIAGSGVAGFTDGKGLAAQFDDPQGLAVDGSGNIYVTDNLRIRKITPDGTVTTLAGTGEPGDADGTGTAAEFEEPLGLTIDDAGNLYVADAYGGRIRKVAPDRTVTTLAGSGAPGPTDGLGPAAGFSYPQGLAIDRAGNVYVAEYAGCRLRKIAPDGSVMTLAGSAGPGFRDGPGTLAQFNGPVALAVDGANNVYVSDQGNDRIRKVAPDGTVTTVAGSGTQGFRDGKWAAAEFNRPEGLAVDRAGNLYVADYGNNRVRKITPGGTVTSLAVR